jgi:hypothetical protein
MSISSAMTIAVEVTVVRERAGEVHRPVLLDLDLDQVLGGPGRVADGVEEVVVLRRLGRGRDRRGRRVRGAEALEHGLATDLRGDDERRRGDDVAEELPAADVLAVGGFVLGAGAGTKQWRAMSGHRCPL